MRYEKTLLVLAAFVVLAMVTIEIFGCNQNMPNEPQNNKVTDTPGHKISTDTWWQVEITTVRDNGDTSMVTINTDGIDYDYETGIYNFHDEGCGVSIPDFKNQKIRFRSK
jgi:hypothetical protein